MKRIETSTIGEILKEEFMINLNLSASSLSKLAQIPETTLSNIINDKEKVTIDISVKLGKFFGLSDDYFLNLQKDIDRRNNQ